MKSISTPLCRRAGITLPFCFLTLALFICFAPAALAQSYSGPLVITKGGTYKGNWESKDSEVAAVEIRTSEPVIIEYSNIRGAGYLIKSWAYSANLTVRHTSGYGLTPTPYRDYKKPRRFVTVNNFQNLVVENCYMESTAGIYAGTRYEGDGTTAETVRIRYNMAKNIDGRVYGGTKEHSQFVQFNFKGAIKHAEVAWNEVINEVGKSLVEDNINIYNTRGTADSPIRIHNNYIHGAFPELVLSTNYSGGGIITDGNAGISDCPAYIEAYDNHLVGLGNYAMGIAGGNNIRYHHNRAVNAATFLDGVKYRMYTSGLWSKDYYKQNTTFANSIDNNVVGVVAWGYSNNRNDVSVAENASFKDNTFLPNPITTQSEKDEYVYWQQKLRQNKLVLGPAAPAPAPAVAAPVNKLPAVSLTSPTANATFAQGLVVPVLASASDADGSIAKVEFYLGTTKLSEDTSAPYSFSWSNAPTGIHSLTARAYDNQNAVAASQAVLVEVTPQATVCPPGTNLSGTGKITAEYWANIGGTAVSSIPLANTPTSVSELTKFETATGVADNYGQRIRGFITAPASGTYTFWISGDDNAELWLSTSEAASGKKKIAYVNGWTYAREWGKYGSQQSAKVALEAGKRYYIEALHKEGGGGDNLAVGWQLPNGMQELPISGIRLSPIGSQAVITTAPVPTPSPTPAPAPVAVPAAAGNITREYWANVYGSDISVIPVDKTPTTTTALTLFEAPSNVGDNYGQRIRGYVTAPVSGQYTFWISGDDNAELWLSTSEAASGKKRIAYVNGWTNPREWSKYGSQQSAKVALEAGKRYYIEALHKEGGGGDNLAVGWQLPNGTQERPIAGNRLSPVEKAAVEQPASTSPIVSVVPTGKILREYWAGVHSSNISDIPVNTRPTSTSELTSFEAPSNVGDNYGQRIRGYITAPATGTYVFWIASDDKADLYLSTSEDPAAKRKIAYVTSWTSAREWGKYGSQQSAKVTLEAGKRYYIEALHLEGGGGDNLAVGWQLPNGTQERPIAGNRLSPAAQGAAMVALASTETAAFAPQASAYPNPFTDVVTLQLPAPATALASVTVHGQDGKLVHSTNEFAMSGNNLELNLQHLRTGLYFLRYTDTEGNTSVTKIIKN